MQNKKTLLVFAMAALAVSIGIATAAVSADDTAGGPAFGCGHDGFQRTQNGTLEMDWAGFQGNATLEDMQAKMESFREERLIVIKEKLGLAEDTPEEDVVAALQQWREENMELIMGIGGPGIHGRMGHGMPLKNW